jgi:uncharacterized membrane protein YfcA
MLSTFLSHAHYAWLVVASFIAGVMNAMAGGGSFVSFPAMLAMGVAPIQANATNTVALWPGQLTSVAALRSDLRRDLLPVVIAASILGGVSGAVVLLKTKQITFLHMVPWLLLVASLLFGISGPVSRWLRRRAEAKAFANMVEHNPDAPPALVPLFLVLLPVCFYIGYFGAGAGFLIMSALALFGIEEMRALNSMKVLAACLSNLCAVLTFIVSGAVIWRYCLISMVICGVGGYLGAQYARRINPDVLRLIVVATGCLMAGYFFWRQA